jgi:hypothetical protein
MRRTAAHELNGCWSTQTNEMRGNHGIACRTSWSIRHRTHLTEEIIFSVSPDGAFEDVLKAALIVVANTCGLWRSGRIHRC